MTTRVLVALMRFTAPTCAAMACALVVAGCSRDQLGDAPPAVASPAEVTLVELPPDGAGRVSYVISLRDSTSLLVGSFRFALHYDTLAMSFDRITGANPQLTAANDVGAKVLIAGASPTGFGAGGWMAVEFVRRGTAVLPETPTIEVLEIGGVMGGDLRQRIVAKPAWGPKD